MNLETLECGAQLTDECKERGGKFERERKRGVKPSRCPECKEADAPVPVGRGPNLEAMKEGRKRRREVRSVDAVKRVLDFREWSRNIAAYDQAKRNGETPPIKPPMPIVIPNDSDFEMAREVGAIS